MATLRTVFILALVLVSLPALYAASTPLRGDVAAGGSAGEDAASWGRKLLEASGGDLDVGGEEEEVGEATDDGLDEAVRVLLSWKKIKNAANQAAKSEAGQKAGGLVKNVVKKGGKEALTAAVNAFRSGKGAKGALQAGAGSFPLPVMVGFLQGNPPLPVMVGFLQGNPMSHWSGGVNLWKPHSPLCTLHPSSPPHIPNSRCQLVFGSCKATQ
ncbi:unnamed protein product [Closterium sp. NIES-64]|nr:unnamed protein product [Closterium sp. NIES-64]